MASPAWVPAAEVCSRTGLSRHQLRQLTKQRLQNGIHFIAGPRPNSPRRYNLGAVWEVLVAGQLRQDNGKVFPPPPRTAVEGIEMDVAADRLRLHDGTDQGPAVVQLGGLNGLLAVIDTLVEIQRQGRRAAGQGRPLTEAHAACPGLRLRAGITTHGLVSINVSDQQIALPLAEVLDLQDALSRQAAAALREEAQCRAALEQMLAATPTNAEVGHAS